MSFAAPELDESSKTELLVLARRTLGSYLSSGQIPDYTPGRTDLGAPSPAFVTLRRGKELRGCVGHLAPERALFLTVQRCSISAALEDTRFMPVRVEELPDLTIEISVLSPFRRVRDIEEIEVGRHGLLISCQGRRGLLLPQVAVENHWDRTTFLEQTCRKAGLPLDSWRRKSAVIEMFSADVFSEAGGHRGPG